jgi:hypothetical protein
MSKLILFLVFLLTLGASALAQVGRGAREPSLPTPGAPPPQQPGPAPPRTRLEQEAIAREQELVAAQRRHDLEFFERVLADDLIDVGGDGKPLRKTQVLAFLPDLEIFEHSMTNVVVKPVGNNAVALSYDVIARATNTGRPVPARQHAMTVWVRREGTWQVLLHQLTPIQ